MDCTYDPGIDGAAPPAPARFEHVDGLRALAALSVFGLHGVYQVAVAATPEAWWYRWGVHLAVGVQVFFAISGFLLYRPLLRATLARRPVDLRAFWWRRAVRIVPAYWVALALITLRADLTEVQSLGGALRFGLFAQVYSPETALRGIGQAWSLDVEVAFYALLPVFALWLVRARTLRAAALGCLGVVAAGVAWKLLALGVTDAARPGTETWLYTLPAHLDALGGGMLLAVLWAWRHDDGHLPRGLLAAAERRPWLPWLGAAVAFGLAGLVAGPAAATSGLPSDPGFLVSRELYAAIGVLLVLPAVLTGDGGGWVRRFLRSAPMRGIGVVSYSFYLWHFLAIAEVAKVWDRPPAGALEWAGWVVCCLGLSLVLATASYWLVERPAFRLRGLVPGRRRGAAVDAVQAAP